MTRAVVVVLTTVVLARAASAGPIIEVVEAGLKRIGMMRRTARIEVDNAALRVRVANQEYATELGITSKLERSPTGELVGTISKSEARRVAQTVRKGDHVLEMTPQARTATELSPDLTDIGRVVDASKARKLLETHVTPIVVVDDLETRAVLRKVAPERAVVLRRSADLNGVRSLDAKIGKVHVYSELPRNPAERGNVFGKELSPAQQTELDQAVESMTKLGATPMGAKATLARLAKAKPEDVHVIIGHNENGVLKMANGDSLLLEDLTRAKGTVVIISCNSLKSVTATGTTILETSRPILGTTTSIRLLEGTRVMNEIAGATTPKTIGELLVAVAKAGGITGLGGYAVFFINLDEAAPQ